jgi:hypothetical protein
MKTTVLTKPIIAAVMMLIALPIFSFTVEFRVKIFEPKSKFDTQKLENYQPFYVFEQYSEVGYFENYLIAMKAQYELEDLGYPSTEIVAYFKGAPISMDDAFTLLNDQNDSDQQLAQKPLTEAEVELALARVKNYDFYYTVFISIKNDTDVDQFFELPKSYHEMIIENGQNRYAYGQFTSFNNANDILKLVKEYGFSDAEIAAFDSLERIPVTIAIEKEKELLEQTLALIKN